MLWIFFSFLQYKAYFFSYNGNSPSMMKDCFFLFGRSSMCWPLRHSWVLDFFVGFFIGMKF